MIGRDQAVSYAVKTGELWKTGEKMYNDQLCCIHDD